MKKPQTCAHLLKTLLHTALVQEPQKREDSPYKVTLESNSGRSIYRCL